MSSAKLESTLARPLDEPRCDDEKEPLGTLCDVLAAGTPCNSPNGEVPLDTMRDSGAECCCGDVGPRGLSSCVSTGSGLKLGLGLNHGSMQIELRRRSNSSAFCAHSFSKR